MKIEDLPYIDVFSPEYAANPASVIDPLRAEHRIARSDRGLEVLRYSDAEDLLSDLRLTQGFVEMFAASGITHGPALNAFQFGIVEAEGADHARLRRAIAPYFSNRTVQTMRDRAHDLVTEWIREHDGDEMDFEQVIARRLPASLFCVMTGIPLEDAERIAVFSEAVNRIFHYEPKFRDFIDETTNELVEYVHEVKEQRRANPGEDILSMILKAQDEGSLSEQDVVNLFIVLLGGSTDNTAAQICMNTIALAEHKEVWQRLKQDPSLIPAAVIEATRFAPAMLTDVRVTRHEAVEFADVEIPQGTIVHANIAAANCDPEVFENPGVFDVDREPGPGPLNFGRGRHYCVGRPLAIMAEEEVIRVMLESWEDFELVGEHGMWGAPFPLRTGPVPIRVTRKVATTV